MQCSGVMPGAKGLYLFGGQLILNIIIYSYRMNGHSLSKL